MLSSNQLPSFLSKPSVLEDKVPDTSPQEIQAYLGKVRQELVETRKELENCQSGVGELEEEIGSLKAEAAKTLQAAVETEHSTDAAGSKTVVITTASGEDMMQLRELVGSMHTNRHSNLDVDLLVVYGFGMSIRHRREISLWRNVEVIDGDEALFVGQTVVSAKISDQASRPETTATGLRFSPRIVLTVLEMNLRKYDQVIYVHSGYRFQRDSVHEMAEYIAQHGALFVVPSTESRKLEDVVVLGIKSGTKHANLFVMFELQCMRGYHCDPYLHRQLEQAQHFEFGKNKRITSAYGLELYQHNPKYYCYLLLRDEILYVSEYGTSEHQDGGHREVTDAAHEHEIESPLDAFPKQKSGKIPVAIGMPTLSVQELGSYEEVAPIGIFLPSLLSTVKNEEWDRFEYWIYIGFDEGDRFFDSPAEREKIDSRLRQMVEQKRAALNKKSLDVRFEYIRFPYSRGWVTYIWNGLFVHAMKDGAHYYYQVNDDLELTSEGWTTYFVDALSKNGNIGVAGPWDWRHGGRLLTQAFVSRKHFFIFGRLYPLDIKDWWSDNWLNDVYGDSNRFSINGVSANNRNDKGTRYNICGEQPRYHVLLQLGQQTFQDWMRDYKEAERLSKLAKPDPVDRQRLTMELEHGPLLS